MNASPPDKRDEFLLHMYDAFWNNITRAENTAWTMIAVYGALIAGVGLAQTLLTPVGAAFVLIVFGDLASSFSASANLWFRRNLTMIGRLESQFLNQSDYGFLLPPKYKEPREFWTIENWTVLIFAYPLVSTVLSLTLLFPPIQNAQSTTAVASISASGVGLVLAAIVLGLAFTVYYARVQSRNYAKFLKETSSPNPGENS